MGLLQAQLFMSYIKVEFFDLLVNYHALSSYDRKVNRSANFYTQYGPAHIHIFIVPLILYALLGGSTLTIKSKFNNNLPKI